MLVDADVGELGGIVVRSHAICGQAIDIRPEAMTTVRDNCDALALSHRNPTAEFLLHLAIAVSRARRRSLTLVGE